jgi:hypothetical protein
MTSGSAVAQMPSAGSLMYSPRITASRGQIDNRFPGLNFNVDTGGHAFYEVLLATDSQLFDPAKAGMRTPANFYSSRQSGGLIPAAEAVHPFFVPSAVLCGFGQAVPRPNAIFYTLIAYDDKEGANPTFAQPPASLSTAAPSVSISRDFTGATLATVLAVSVDKLQRVGTSQAPSPPSPKEDAAEGEDGYGALPVPPSTPPAVVPRPSVHASAAAEAAQPADDFRLAVLPPVPSPGVTPPAGVRPHDPLLPGQRASGPAGGSVAHNGHGGHNGQAAPGLALGADFDPGEGAPGYLADDDDGDRDSAYGTPAGLGADYQDEVDELDLHPSRYQSLDEPQQAAGAAARPLTVDDKMRVIDRIAQFESGGDFSAVNADGEFEGLFGVDHPAYHRYHVGLSYGFVQFTQDSGKLGQLLKMMQDRDLDEFARAFGSDSDQLIAVTTASGPPSAKSPGGRSARVQPVAGADLWQEPWLSRFRTAGANPRFQAAQRELAARAYLDPMLRFAGWLGLSTERALTMVADRSIQMGLGGARRWIISAVGPLGAEATRRQALAALGHPDLRSFQAATPGLRADGEWGPSTHAAMVSALRALGPASPVPIPTTDQMIEAMVRRGASEPWHSRIETLRAAAIPDARYVL